MQKVFNIGLRSGETNKIEEEIATDIEKHVEIFDNLCTYKNC